MSFRTTAAAFLAITALSQQAHAYTIIGSGTSSCATWTADRASPQRFNTIEDGAWVLGFLSGVGYVGRDYDPLNALDANAVFGWIDNYCRANLLVNVEVAAAAFVSVHPR